MSSCAMDTDEVDAEDRGRWLEQNEGKLGDEILCVCVYVYMFWMWLVLRWHYCSNHCDEFMVFFLTLSLSLSHTSCLSVFCFK